MAGKKKSKVVPINRIDDSKQCAIISAYKNGKTVTRLKELKKARGNCHFTGGVSRDLIDCAYRAGPAAFIRTRPPQL